MLVQRPYVRRDGHLIVIQNNEDVLLEHPAIIQCFVSDAARHRAIADDGDDSEIFSRKIPRGCDTARRADGG
jgi:hypothetical protein